MDSWFVTLLDESSRPHLPDVSFNNSHRVTTLLIPLHQNSELQIKAHKLAPQRAVKPFSMSLPSPS